ncbi:MAG: TonB-dependent receptor [Neisseriaceae bacterium]|nr:TonB-dependent receptor [Neisseriaceae bacterium]
MTSLRLKTLTLSLMAVFSTVAYADETNTEVSGSLNHQEIATPTARNDGNNVSGSLNEQTVQNNTTDTNHSGNLKKGKTDNATELETIVVEATRTPVGNMKYAGSVGVLTPQDMESTTNVIDAMMSVPGVDGGMDAGRHAGKQFQIRGFGYQSEDRVIIKQDGVPRSPGLYGNFVSSFRTDTDILKRVEVTKGASSILHGSGSIGGIVSMESKNARDFLNEDEQMGVMFGNRVESNNMHSVRSAVYGDFEKAPIDFVIYGKKADYGTTKFAEGGSHYAKPGEEMPYSYNDETARTALFKVGSTLGNHRVQFSAFNYDEKLNTLWQTLWNNSNDLFVKGKLKQRDFVFDYKYNPETEWVDLAFKAYKSKAKYDRGYQNYGIPPNTLQYANIDNRWGFSLNNNATFNTGSLKHHLVTGLDYGKRDEDAVYVLNGVKSDFGSFPNTWKDLGIYAQNITQLGNAELTLGGRFDKFKREVKKENAQNFSDSRFSPRVALAYTFFDRLTLLGGYSESFRAPTPHETLQKGPMNRMYYYVPNPNLKSETAKEYEVGFSFQDESLLHSTDKLKIKGVYFNGKIDDMIALKARPDMGKPPKDGNLDPQQYGQYQNVDTAKRHGFELSADYKIGDFKFGTSYERLKIYDTATGEDINRHANKVQANIGYSPIENLDLNFKVSHWFNPHSNPSSYESGGETYYYVDKGFTIADFKAKYTFKKNAKMPFLSGGKISVGVNNIFNKQYISANRTRDTTMVGKGRSYWLDYEVKF